MKKMILSLIIIFATTSSFAFLSRGYNIEELSNKASVVFMGEVTKVRESVSNNANDLPYVEVEFKVFESMKGKVPSVYSFRQFAPKVGKQFKLLGMDKTSYNVGQKLVMFLGAPGSKGLAAPIDFQLFQLQTKSNRQADIDSAIVLNHQLSENMGKTLFQNLKKTNTLRLVNQIQSAQKTTSGISYKDFRNLIEASVE